MLTFQFGSDAKLTLIPKVNDEPIPQSEMVDLTVKIVNKNRGVNFTPLWDWNDIGIEIEIQRDSIPASGVYTVVLDWRRPDATYSDGFQDRMNYCTLIEFSRSCNIVSEDTAVVEVSPEYKGDPGDSAYQIAVENGFVGTESEWLASLKGDPFTYDDFTPEQIEELQRPATEAAASIPALMSNYTLNGGSSKTTQEIEDEIVQLAGEVSDSTEKAGAASLAELNARLLALEKIVSATITNKLEVTKEFNVWGKTNLILIGSGAASFAPDFIGQKYIDTAGGNVYVAVGVDTAGNWKLV